MMREERKVVTVLVADLADSTALGETLDPEDAKLVVGEAVAQMVHAVEEFGGTIKDLAGDGILALFGAPVTHEDDPERAVRAALRIVNEVRDYGAEVARAWGVDGFAARVGVSTGTVVVGEVGAGSRVEYGAVGDAVNTAARLEAAAAAGTVLVGAETQRLVDRLCRSGEPVSLGLKGKAEPFEAYEAPETADPPRAHESVQVRLVGRESELAVAREAADGGP